jgi:hypothetical protein
VTRGNIPSPRLVSLNLVSGSAQDVNLLASVYQDPPPDSAGHDRRVGLAGASTSRRYVLVMEVGGCFGLVKGGDGQAGGDRVAVLTLLFALPVLAVGAVLVDLWCWPATGQQRRKRVSRCVGGLVPGCQGGSQGCQTFRGQEPIWTQAVMRCTRFRLMRILIGLRACRQRGHQPGHCMW